MTPMGAVARKWFNKHYIACDLRIMVIDEDLTCLKILETILLTCHYRVAAFTDVHKALQCICDRRNEIDLIIIDYSMTQITGLELLELLILNVNKPVITMCSDDDPRILSEALTRGACFHMTKPLSVAGLDVVWQKSWQHKGKLQARPSARKRRRSPENRSPDDDQQSSHDQRPNKAKRKRLMWNSELHRRFLVAVTLLGKGDEIPTNILSLMNVEGLTIKQVASHLQKHRKRVEKEKKQQREKSKGKNPNPLIPLISTKLNSYSCSSKRLKFPTTLNPTTDKNTSITQKPLTPRSDHLLLLPPLACHDQRVILPRPELNSNFLLRSFLPTLNQIESNIDENLELFQSIDQCNANNFMELGPANETSNNGVLGKNKDGEEEEEEGEGNKLVEEKADDFDVSSFLLDEEFLHWMMNDNVK